MVETVELHHAFSWICDNCGKRNFERGISSEMSPEDLELAKSQDGIDLEEMGDFVLAPDKVKCKNCGTEYEAE